jgi:DNA uptake protein ComE-like DNA-binding protein
MAILTLLLYAFLGEMQVEYALAGSFGDEKKAEQLAWSAIDQGCALVENDLQPWQTLTDPWSEDRARFFESPLGDGAFTVFHPTYADDGRFLWGLEDEASKINLNYASREVLLKLPRVTEEIADSIIDWRDQDQNPGPTGAEDSFYGTLTPPYRAKNQPFETLEELLYVRGVTPEILYGKDANLNGRHEQGEIERNARPDPGLYGLVTVWSSGTNLTQEGLPRLNVNGNLAQVPNDQLLQYGLTRDDLDVILAYQIFSGGPVPTLAHLLTHQDERLGRFEGFAPRRFKQVVDKFTVFEGDAVPGQVNVNTAPKQVLVCLPGITPAVADQIISRRTAAASDLSNIGWLADVVEPRVLQQFANFITVRSYQYRINAVGRVGTPYGARGVEAETSGRPGAVKRMMAVFDKLAEPRPRLVYWKDMTRFGMPYDPSEGPDQVP